MSEYKPSNPDTDPAYNREPGIVIVPGSNYAKEMEKFEQFPSKFGGAPGNPYIFRAYPCMLFRAEMFQGRARCMAAPPDAGLFSNPDEFRRAEAAAKRFTEQCQRIVNNDEERQKAFESGWRSSPADAVAVLEGGENVKAQVTAERNYEDRNMSEPAKREAEAAVAEVGGEHMPEIPEKPIHRRRKVAVKRKKTTRRKG